MRNHPMGACNEWSLTTNSAKSARECAEAMVLSLSQIRGCYCSGTFEPLLVTNNLPTGLRLVIEDMADEAIGCSVGMASVRVRIYCDLYLRFSQIGEGEGAYQTEGLIHEDDLWNTIRQM